MKSSSWFERFAAATVTHTGKPWAFTGSVLLVVMWAVTGPIFQYNDTWQLVINTATTIITFWMVFVIQHGQNKDTKAIMLKLDEIIRAGEARDRFIGIESESEEQLDHMKEQQG